MTLFGLRSGAWGFMFATLLNAPKYDGILGMDCSQAIRVVLTLLMQFHSWGLKDKNILRECCFIYDGVLM